MLTAIKSPSYCGACRPQDNTEKARRKITGKLSLRYFPVVCILRKIRLILLQLKVEAIFLSPVVKIKSPETNSFRVIPVVCLE